MSISSADRSVYIDIPNEIKILPEKDLLKRFNDCLKNKAGFSNEAIGSMKAYDGINGYYRSDIILTLINNKYRFLSSHFNRFVSAICYNTNLSWLCNLGLSDPSKRLTAKYHTIINYFFSYFIPTKAQFATLSKNSTFSKYKQSVLWLECLVNRGYKIPECFYTTLFKTKYDICNYFAKNGIQITPAMLNLFLSDDTKIHISKFTKVLKMAKLEPSNKILISYIRLILGKNKPDKNCRKILEIFISKGIKPDDEVLKEILESDVDSIPNLYVVLQGLLDNNIKLTDKYVYDILEKHKSPELLLAFINNKINITTGMINIILKDRFYINLPKNKVYNLLDVHLSLFSRNNKITPDILFNHLKLKPTLETIKSMFQFANTPQETSIIQNMIIQYNLIPDKECLLEAVRSDNIDFIRLILKYKIPVDDDVFEQFVRYGKSQNILKLLIHCGITIDFDKLVKLLRKGICLESLDGLEFDKGEKLYYVCYVFGKLKQYNSEITVNYKKKELRDMFENESLPTILQFMKENNLKPDRYCLENSFNNTFHLEVKSFLLDNGFEPTPNCLGLSRNYGYKYAKTRLKKVYTARVGGRFRYRRRYRYDRVPRKAHIDQNYRRMLYDINKTAGIDHNYMAKEYDIDLND